MTPETTMCIAEVDDIYMMFPKDFTVWRGLGGLAIGFYWNCIRHIKFDAFVNKCVHRNNHVHRRGGRRLYDFSKGRRSLGGIGRVCH